MNLTPWPCLQFKKGDRVIALTFGYHWDYQEYGAPVFLLLQVYRALGGCTVHLMPAVLHAAFLSTAICLRYLCCLLSLHGSSPQLSGLLLQVSHVMLTISM